VAGTAARSAKSNRAQGDLFELLLLRGVVRALRAGGHGVKFAYGEQLADLEAAVVAAHGAAARPRLAQQERACALAAPVVDELLAARARRIGSVKALLWTGRETGLDVAATDLEAVHERGATRLSLKSTLSGTGTLKNFGGASLGRLLGVDVAVLAAAMTARVEAALHEALPVERWAGLAPMRQVDRRHAMTDPERALARGAAYPVLEELSGAVLAALTTLPQEQRARFVAYGLALPQGVDPDLFTLVVNGDGSVLAPPSGLPSGPVTAERASAVSNVVRCDGVPVFRVTISCTNGIGLSPLCARTFEVPGAPPRDLPEPAREPLEALLDRAADLAAALRAALPDGAPAALADDLVALLARAADLAPGPVEDPPGRAGPGLSDRGATLTG